MIKGAGIPQGLPTQWGGQVFFYLLWKFLGYEGITAFRVLAFTSVLLLLYAWMREEGVPLPLSIVFLLIPAFILLSFPSERPQMLSFLLLPLMLYLLEGLRKRKWANHWLLPLILIVWANLHAGFLLGLAALWVYFLAALISFARGKIPFKALSFTLVPALALPVAAALAVPGAFRAASKVALSLFTPTPYMETVLEYMTPFAAAARLGDYFIAYWVGLAVVLAALALKLRRMPLEHALLIALFAGLSLWALRFMPLVGFVVPVAARAIYGEAEKDGKTGSPLVTALMAVLLAAMAAIAPYNLKTGPSGEFPKEAVVFLKEKNPPGAKIFNFYHWAGYLAWEAPEKDFFMPVENITAETDKAYEKIIHASNEEPGWSELLRSHGLDTILIPGVSPATGRLYPLIEALETDRGWHLVYSDRVSNIFMRDTEQTGDFISRHSIAKSGVYRQAISQAQRCLADKRPVFDLNPKHSKRLWRTTGDAYVKLGLYNEAARAYSKEGWVYPLSTLVPR